MVAGGIYGSFPMVTRAEFLAIAFDTRESTRAVP